MLKGHQFFAHEIIPVLQAANAYACRIAIGSLDFEPQPDDQKWMTACSRTAALMLEANEKFAIDEKATGLSPVYNETSLWWQQVEWDLKPFTDIPEVEAAVAALPVDLTPLPGPSWMFPMAIGMGALAAIGGAYWWTRR